MTGMDATDNTEIAAEARARLRHLAAGLADRTGDPLLTADLFFEVAVAVALSVIEPDILAEVMTKRAADIAQLGRGARFDA